jgi:hypothetical protein
VEDDFQLVVKLERCIGDCLLQKDESLQLTFKICRPRDPGESVLMKREYKAGRGSVLTVPCR